MDLEKVDKVVTKAKTALMKRNIIAIDGSGNPEVEELFIIVNKLVKQLVHYQKQLKGFTKLAIEDRKGKLV